MEESDTKIITLGLFAISKICGSIVMTGCFNGSFIFWVWWLGIIAVPLIPFSILYGSAIIKSNIKEITKGLEFIKISTNVIFCVYLGLRFRMLEDNQAKALFMQICFIIAQDASVLALACMILTGEYHGELVYVSIVHGIDLIASLYRIREIYKYLRRTHFVFDHMRFLNF